MATSALLVLAVLAACVVASEVLTRRTALRHLGTALVVIVLTAVVANLGIIPTGTADVPLYGALFGEVAWLSIFWLLLGVNLRSVLGAGRVMIALFLVGCVGTMAGAVVGMWAIDGAQRLGASSDVLAGMFTGTYTGGSINFIAIASHYRLTDGATLVSANAVDAAMTTVWMAVTLAVPRWLGKRPWLAKHQGVVRNQALGADHGTDDDTETVHPIDLGILLFLGAAAVWASQQLESWSAHALGVAIPGILILTTIALLLAQVPAAGRLRGARLLGMFGVYLFLAVIGALCDIKALIESGALGASILAFVTVLLVVHGVILFGVAVALRLDPDIAAVASQANIGGGASALALARSLGRGDLVLPAILVGSLGSALGTYLGIAVTTFLPGG